MSSSCGVSRGCWCSRLALTAIVLLCATLACVVEARETRSPAPQSKEFAFSYDHILGTSLDVVVVAPSEASAETAETAILDEIERLRLVFSTYDAASEISRLNRATGPVAASAEMRAVLREYEVWQRRSGGAFNGQLGALVAVWKEAEKTGVEPSPATLERIVGAVNRPGWQIDDSNGTITRLTSQPLNLNAIAKGYIIRQAAAAARSKVPSLRGLLLNLGGDILTWGEDGAGRAGWLVGVQDPFQPQENAPLMTALRLSDFAVATSAAYERPYRVGDRRYSHIFDPRTGRPAHGVASATVVARDNTTANALATTLCVLTPQEGLRLVAATPNAECLLVTAAGKQLRSPGFRALEIVRPEKQLEVAATGNDSSDVWPDDFQVQLTITLPVPTEGKKIRRPYVAVWIESSDGTPVRSVAVWGNSPKYLKDLSDWWKFARRDTDVVKAVTRATRGPGKYSLVWDGKDDKGKRLPQGTYTVHVEVTREYGRHVGQTGKIDCKADAARTTLEKNAETDATLVEYKKR